MPRADPTRSAYCASRHLLRNLDDAAELRRNPLLRSCFADSADAHDPAPVLDRVRGLVHASLAGCRQRAGARSHGTLGRMHAALLRCEIDKQPLSVVAAELGLSARQIRRERRAAHDAFLRAFAERTAAPAQAAVRDRAELRLARAAEMHELGQSALALTACDEVAAAAPAEHRVEALCLAADIERDCGRYAASKGRIDRATAALADVAPAGSADALALARERTDLTAWALRRALGDGCALALAPPAVTAHAAAEDARNEPRVALLVRALAAYAEQRWEVGDAATGHGAVLRAWRLIPRLDPARTKERLGVMLADARMAGLSGRDDHAQYLAAERLATRHGHVRARLIARAERLGTEMSAHGCGPLMAAVLDELEGAERKTMPWAVAAAAVVGLHVDCDEHRRDEAHDLVQRLLPPRSALALLARASHLSGVLVARPVRRSARRGARRAQRRRSRRQPARTRCRRARAGARRARAAPAARRATPSRRRDPRAGPLRNVDRAARRARRLRDAWKRPRRGCTFRPTSRRTRCDSEHIAAAPRTHGRWRIVPGRFSCARPLWPLALRRADAAAAEAARRRRRFCRRRPCRRRRRRRPRRPPERPCCRRRPRRSRSRVSRRPSRSRRTDTPARSPPTRAAAATSRPSRRRRRKRRRRSRSPRKARVVHRRLPRRLRAARLRQRRRHADAGDDPVNVRTIAAASLVVALATACSGSSHAVPPAAHAAG